MDGRKQDGSMDAYNITEVIHMKRRFIAILLILLMLMSVPAFASDNLIIGESVDLNVGTKHIVPGEIILPDKSEVIMSSIDETGYQANVGALVIVLAFDDTDESEYEGLGAYLDMVLNGETNSLKAIFADVSGGKVTYTAQIPQLNQDGTLNVVKDAHPRAYYERYMQELNPIGFQFNENGMGETAESNKRLYEFITSSLENIPKDSLDATILDGNGDGMVDNVITLFPDPAGQWADLLWPMSTDLSKELYPLLTNNAGETTLGVKQITFQNYSVGLNTLYHETCHSLGLGDVYNYIDQSRELGKLWTPMSNGRPYGMNSIERESLGWLTPEELIPTVEPVRYTLKALDKEGGGAYKIPITDTQSIYLEYRKADNALEYGIPSSGLLAWRCDLTLKNINGNAYGPPYYQYLYRPFGDETAKESTINAAFSQNNGRTAMGCGTATPLYFTTYAQVEVSTDNPPAPNEMVFSTGDGRSIVFRLSDVQNLPLSIYDIEEIEGDQITFMVKMNEPDTLVFDPVFSTAPGSYSENITLELTSPNEDEIRYTLDGSDPTQSSPLYTQPIYLAGAVTVKAACFKDGVRSNIVEANYFCFANDDSGVLPAFDGTGKSEFELTVPYNVVRISFEDLQDDSVSGTVLIYDVQTNSGGRFYANQLFGKSVRLVTNGDVVILAESSNAKFKVSGYTGINEPVSKTPTSLGLLNDGKTVIITTSLKNNTNIPQNAKTIIALYNDGKLVQTKIIDEVLYNSKFSYLTGAYLEYADFDKCGIYVWDSEETITPMMYDLTSTNIAR